MNDKTDFGLSDQALRLGAQVDSNGVQFTVYSAHAEKLELCLFDEAGQESQRIEFAERTGGLWHAYVPGLRPGAQYGLRAHGPYDPDHGHRFNPNKLLLDPYAKAISGRFGDHALLCGYQYETDDDLTFDTRDSASAMPRCIVTEDRFDWGGDRPPGTLWERTVIF